MYVFSIIIIIAYTLLYAEAYSPLLSQSLSFVLFPGINIDLVVKPFEIVEFFKRRFPLVGIKPTVFSKYCI